MAILRCEYQVILRDKYVCIEAYNHRSCPYHSYLCDVKRELENNSTDTK